MEQLNNGIAKINYSGNTTNIEIPVKRSYPFIIIVTIWLFIWFSFISSFGSMFSITNDDGIDVFFIVWMILWLLSGLAVFGFLLWNLLAKERVIVDSKKLILKKGLFGIGSNKTFGKKHVTNLRFIERPNDIFSYRNRMATWGLGEGKVKFDYGMRSFSFGLGLDDAEANYLIKMLKEKVSN